MKHRQNRFVEGLRPVASHPRDPAPLIATGLWRGRILEAPSGSGGFGYDPVFWVPEEGCSAAELPPEIKNRLSHRGMALAALVERIRDEF